MKLTGIDAIDEYHRLFLNFFEDFKNHVNDDAVLVIIVNDLRSIVYKHFKEEESIANQSGLNYSKHLSYQQEILINVRIVKSLVGKGEFQLGVIDALFNLRKHFQKHIAADYDFFKSISKGKTFPTRDP